MPVNGGRGLQPGSNPFCLGERPPKAACVCLGGCRPPALGGNRGNPCFQPKSSTSGAPPESCPHSPASPKSKGGQAWNLVPTPSSAPPLLQEAPGGRLRLAGDTRPCQGSTGAVAPSGRPGCQCLPGAAFPATFWSLPFSSKVSRRFGAKPGSERGPGDPVVSSLLCQGGKVGRRKEHQKKRDKKEKKKQKTKSNPTTPLSGRGGHWPCLCASHHLRGRSHGQQVGHGSGSAGARLLPRVCL